MTQPEYQSDKGSQNAKTRQNVRNHFQKSAMGIVIDLILADVVPDICRAVCLPEIMQVFLVFCVKVRDAEDCCTRLCNGRHIAASVGNGFQLLRCLIKPMLRLAHASESDPAADNQDDNHRCKETAVVDDVAQTGVERNVGDRHDHGGSHKADDPICDFPHIPLPPPCSFRFLSSP